MARPEQPESRGRTQRKKRLTTKAQEAHDAGQLIPGLAPSTATSTTPLSPDLEPEAPSLLLSPSPLRAQDALRATKRLASMKISGAPPTHRMPPKPTASYHAPSGTIIPPLGDDFAIYFWPHPKPKNFTQLSPAQRKWKDATDRNDPLLFHDSELVDDWAEFAGNVDYYWDPKRGDTRPQAIATTFVSRAKRAYVAGKSWEQFEIEEEDIDSTTAAVVKEPDQSKWREILDEALDNGLRLAVFDQLKSRLCREIWSQPYRPRGPGSIEARAKAEHKGRALVRKIDQSVERWEFREGWQGEAHPVPVFKEDLEK